MFVYLCVCTCAYVYTCVPLCLCNHTILPWPCVSIGSHCALALSITRYCSVTRITNIYIYLNGYIAFTSTIHSLNFFTFLLSFSLATFWYALQFCSISIHIFECQCVRMRSLSLCSVESITDFNKYKCSLPMPCVRTVIVHSIEHI